MYFNPYALAFAIAVQVIMSAMTCDQNEAMLAMKRGADLCSPKIGDWCTKAVLGVCITRRESYCCYNSKFARIINVQDVSSLGWLGRPRGPELHGFHRCTACSTGLQPHRYVGVGGRHHEGL